MIEIATQTEHNEGVLQKDISKRQVISEKYLDHIIAALKAGGLICNVGGKKSGYKLTVSAKDITVYDIYRAFNPEMAIVNCLNDLFECDIENICAVQSYWSQLNDVIIENMKKTTLSQLADKQITLRNSQAEQDYQI
jgi:Rrf2 family protein